MFNFVKNWQKSSKLKAQIEKYQAKAEVLKYKNALQANKSIAKRGVVGRALKEIEASDNLKEYIAENLPQSELIQVLNNPTVQQLIKAAAIKLMGGGSVSTQDDDLIQMYKALPNDIKQKVKLYAMEYISGGK